MVAYHHRPGYRFTKVGMQDRNCSFRRPSHQNDPHGTLYQGSEEVIASQYARLFMDNVFQLHGMPEVIISDRDPRFVSKFWKELFSLLEMDLWFSTTFHPQIDGQSEVTIRVLDNFLQPCIEHRPSIEVDQLPLAEFATNNAVNDAKCGTPQCHCCP